VIGRAQRWLGWIPGRPPTDFEFLLAIYERHKDDFIGSMDEREAAIAVPLDVPAIADDLDVHPHIVVGRLYHHLNPKFVASAEGKFLFALKAGEMVNVVNWPVLQAVLAGLWEQRGRDRLALNTAIVSLTIAIVSLAVSIFA
jgi:hypothetical protein